MTEKTENTRSQNAAILNALRNGEIITPISALKRFDCMRLSARVYDLRVRGHNIKMVKRGKVGANGKVKYYGEYWLEKAA